jgi:acyl-CoA synthetase (AMP-forming)/AMP-acid ligase II
MNLHGVLATAAATWPRRTALIDVDAPDGERRISYDELWGRVRRLSAGMQALGLKPGERVAMLIGNSWEYVATFFAASAAGLISVPMNTRLLENELAHMVRDSGARLLIAQESLLRERPGLACIPELGVAAVRTSGASPERPFEVLDAQPGAAAASVPDSVASLLYTSGTTGAPKGAMLPHASWISVSDYVRKYLRYADDEVTVHSAALTHGSGFLLLPTFAAGGTNVVCAKFDPERVLALFGRLGVTNGFFVPTMIQMLLDAPWPADHGSWRLRNLYYAGSPIDPGTLREAMERFGPVLIQSFAQTEAPMFLTVLDHAEHRRIGERPQLIRSAGKVLSDADVRIFDDNDCELPTGEIGEVVARAPHVMKGYWNRREATAETLRNGWLHTGDVGRFDEEGYLYIVDRKKDMIISGGSNVYAREVEQALLAMDAVKEVAVIGLPHPKWGEMVTAVMVSRTGAALPDEAMEGFCRANIADYRRPKRFIWVDSLPRNAYGKVLKRELRARYAQKEDQHA